MRSDIREGETFPDYELADQSGRRRSLSELQGGNPMVLHLSRGGFDPKEHQFVGQLVGVYPEFRNAYTRLALISTDNQLNINEFRDARVPRGRSCPTPIGSSRRIWTSRSSRMSRTIR